MPFNSPEFALFFAFVLCAVVTVPQRFEGRVLLAASLLFYTLFVPRMLPVLVCFLGVNYLLLWLMVRSARPWLFLLLQVAVSLSTLLLFKYGAFAVGLAFPELGQASGAKSFLSSLVLPLGISFFSFEVISIGVDVHRGRIPCPTFGRYLLFVTFFPHLIAGPIMRGEELLPQFVLGGERNAARTRRGIWLFVGGVLKKTLLSDFLLQPFVTEVFQAPGAFSGPVHLVAMYSFAFQIYLDFSGYSDMARGLSCLLGFELPMNFEEPYLSRDPSEFWRRWHITLSRWLRDYLYVPLGGNRRGPVRTQVNLLVTMLLGGLWHGAGLNFALWGALHGLLLVAYRLAGKTGSGHAGAAGAVRLRDAPRIFVLFHLVCLVWIPFRARNVADTLAFLRGLASGGYLRAWPVLPLAVAGGCFALHVAERALRKRLPRLHEALSRSAWGAPIEGALLGAALVLAVLASGAGVQFIYFQF